MAAKQGYSFIGRYNVLDRATNADGYDWPIDSVLNRFGPYISNAVSLGCSTGVNEILLGINYPHLNLKAIDINSGRIDIAKSGKWSLKDIRPSGIGVGCDDITLQELYERFCPQDYFEIDFEKSVLELLRPVPSVNFMQCDAMDTHFDDESFDLVMAHMLRGETCFIYDESYARLGEEIERIVKPQGLFWYYPDTIYSGLFRVIPKGDGSSPFHRILNRNGILVEEKLPTSRELLFTYPFQVDDMPEEYVISDRNT